MATQRSFVSARPILSGFAKTRSKAGFPMTSGFLTSSYFRPFSITTTNNKKSSSLRILHGQLSLDRHPRNRPKCSYSSASSSTISTKRDSSFDKSSRQNSIQSSLEELKDSGLLSKETEFSTNSYELDRHGRGESHHRGFLDKENNDDNVEDYGNITPDVIVRPKTVQDVSAILKFCNENRIPVIPYGAGTSVEGHVCALENWTISLDMNAFQTIVLPGEEEDENDNNAACLLPDPIATVGAGVTRKQLNEALRHTGMQFVVDPGADASLGGMVATGASGTTAVRYGTMRENLLGLECVLADGTIVQQIGTKALKSSAGYDLVGLMCGSEGTLGVITSVTVKLHPIPEHVVASVCVFDSLEDAANAVAMLKFCEIPMVRCELLDATSVAAFNKDVESSNSSSAHTKMEEKPTLFLEFQASSEETLKEHIKATEEICEDFSGSDFRFTSGEDERKALWAARHNLYYASINLRKGATTAVLTDACVPLSKFAQVIDETVKDVRDQGVVGPCFGHAGDGNFHCILPVKETQESDDYMDRVFKVQENIIRRTLEAGGTCTGEHGVGYGKIQYLADQYGPGAVHMMELVKKSLDSNNILNPGKVVKYTSGSPL